MTTWRTFETFIADLRAAVADDADRDALLARLQTLEVAGPMLETIDLPTIVSYLFYRLELSVQQRDRQLPQLLEALGSLHEKIRGQMLVTLVEEALHPEKRTPRR
jgi:hypothetical protein